MITVPFRYQFHAARFCHKCNGKALLAMEQGTGKSLTALLYATRYAEASPCVVVCPASLKYNWENEAKRHFGMRCEVLSGTTPSKRQPYEPAPIRVVNYDILGPWVKYLRDGNPGLVILDECQLLASRNTRRLKAVRALCQGTPKVIGLSGTPVTNRPAELWPTLNLIRPDLFPSFHAFGMRYCGARLGRWGWEYKGATHLDELHVKLTEGPDACMIRMRKADVLADLPGKRHMVVTLPIEDEAQYRTAEKNFLLWLAKTRPEKLHGAVAAQRLTQIGYLKRLAGQLKLPAVMDWVDAFLSNGEGKLVLFAVHHLILDALKARYGRLCVLVDGRSDAKDRQQCVDAFQKNPGIRLFLGNIQAAGKGLTLTASSTVAFAELDWTPGAHLQGADRVNRIGTTQECDIYWLIAHGTIEETLAQVIQAKQQVLDACIDGGTPEGQGLNVYDQLVQEMEAQA